MELWEQAIRLARAFEDAQRVGNTKAARVHRQALLETLEQIIKMETKNVKENQ